MTPAFKPSRIHLLIGDVVHSTIVAGFAFLVNLFPGGIDWNLWVLVPAHVAGAQVSRLLGLQFSKWQHTLTATLLIVFAAIFPFAGAGILGLSDAAAGNLGTAMFFFVFGTMTPVC